jgi:hypothetical protein
MKIDLGEIIRSRIAIFPALERPPDEAPPAWGLFPPFTLSEEQLAGNLEYRYPVTLFSRSPAELEGMINRVISVALDPVDAGAWELWLHATALSPAMRLKGVPLFERRITYIFRARRVYSAPTEYPSGSIVEIPREPAPEDLEKQKPKQEVKNG